MKMHHIAILKKRRILHKDAFPGSVILCPNGLFMGKGTIFLWNTNEERVYLIYSLSFNKWRLTE